MVHATQVRADELFLESNDIADCGLMTITRVPIAALLLLETIGMAGYGLAARVINVIAS